MTPGTSTLRTFLALYPDDPARAAMAEVIEELRHANPSIKWERPAQVHITAKFLGDVPASFLAGLASALAPALGAMPPMRGTIDKPGVFPNFREPRIVWLGFSRPPALLATVRTVVEDCCAGLGHAREKQPWVPHLTVGRVKERSFTRELENEIATCNFDPIPVRFGSLCIMESVLAPTGAVHRVHARIDFKG